MQYRKILILLTMGSIIGIGGVSCTGKSDFASKLVAHLGEDQCFVLSQDDYVFPEDQIPMIKDHIDWEVPGSIDFTRIYQTVHEKISSYSWVIVEGLMAFWDQVLFNEMDVKIFMEIGRPEFIRRKRIDLRWGREPDWYIEYVWEAYLKYGRFPAHGSPDIRINGEKPVDIASICDQIRSLTPCAPRP